MAKRVVIVGAGFFGIWCANKLLKYGHEVKLISKSKFAYFLVSAPRVPVQNDLDRTVFQLTDVVDAGVDIVHDEVTMLEEGSVKLKEGGELSYDVLIVATGAKWPDPIGSTYQFGDDPDSYFAEEHKKIENAKHIVLIGGGYTNAELAGELHDRYKEELREGTKKVTMIHSRKLLLPEDGFYCEKLRKRVTEWYQKETDIELILEERASVSVEDPKIVIAGDQLINADLVIHSTGVHPSVPPHNFPDFTDEKGFIKVKDTFQSTSVEKGNVFAIGDVANLNYKGLVLRYGWISTLIHNVNAIIRDPKTPSTSLKKSDRTPFYLPSIVTLGAHAGCGQLFTVPYTNYTLMLPEWVCRLVKSRDMNRGLARWLMRNG